MGAATRDAAAAPNRVPVPSTKQARVARITIRNLDTSLLEELAVRASCTGRTPAEEARTILRHALTRPLHDELGHRLHFMFARLGGVELELPARATPPRVPELADPPRLPEQMA